ncbi:hypothetical protein ANHS_2113 [Ligilactobacillus ruminis ATCC 25644]|nr:hypothetical protein ANHS_2113 [Ligilactobacillus ruminis ATCC 25644]
MFSSIVKRTLRLRGAFFCFWRCRHCMRHQEQTKKRPFPTSFLELDSAF